MPSRTPTFNLSALDDVADPIRQILADGGKMLGADRYVIDALLRGFAEHTHNGITDAVSEMTDPPTLTLDTAAGGLEPGTTYYYLYTLVDDVGREQGSSDIAEITIPDQVATPGAPTLDWANTGGSLGSGVYNYVVSAYTTDTNAETMTGNIASIALRGGTLNTVTVSFPDAPADATGWNVYVLRPGAIDYAFITSVDIGEPFWTDDGSITPDANRRTPMENTTVTLNTVTVELPGAVPANHHWKVYRTQIAGEWDNSFLHSVVEETSEGSGVIVTTFEDFGYPQLTGTPPETTVGQFANPSKVHLTGGAEVSGILPGDMLDFFIQAEPAIGNDVEVTASDPGVMYALGLAYTLTNGMDPVNVILPNPALNTRPMLVIFIGIPTWEWQGIVTPFSWPLSALSGEPQADLLNFALITYNEDAEAWLGIMLGGSPVAAPAMTSEFIPLDSCWADDSAGTPAVKYTSIQSLSWGMPAGTLAADRSGVCGRFLIDPAIDSTDLRLHLLLWNDGTPISPDPFEPSVGFLSWDIVGQTDVTDPGGTAVSGAGDLEIIGSLANPQHVEIDMTWGIGPHGFRILRNVDNILDTSDGAVYLIDAWVGPAFP